MNKLKWLLGALSITLVLLFSCNDPSTIGSELLDEDQFEFEFMDSLTLRARTVKNDSLRVYQLLSSAQLVNYQLGDFEDPIFGRVKSEIITQVEINSFSAGGIRPDFEGTLDSAVFILPFNGEGLYGNSLGQPFDVELWQLDERLDYLQEYNAEEEFAASTFIQSTTIRPDTGIVEIITPGTLNEIDTLFQGQVRIPLDYDKALEFFEADTLVYDDDDPFAEFHKGFIFRPASTTPGITSFQMLARNNSDLEAGLRFYYHVDSLNGGRDYRTYLFPVGLFSANFTTFEHDYTGTIVEDAFNQDFSEEVEYCFVQSMIGVDTEIELPYINDSEELSAVAINKAILEFSVFELAGDDTITYPPIDQLLISEVREDGSLSIIRDLSIVLPAADDIQFIADRFGGNFEEDGKYRLNMAAHLQEVLEGNATNKLRITPYFRGDKASRIVIGGPGNPDAPMKLQIYYTKL